MQVGIKTSKFFLFKKMIGICLTMGLCSKLEIAIKSLLFFYGFVNYIHLYKHEVMRSCTKFDLFRHHVERIYSVLGNLDISHVVAFRDMQPWWSVLRSVMHLQLGAGACVYIYIYMRVINPTKLYLLRV